MDETGRVIVPSDIVHQAGLEPGAELEVRLRDGVIELLPSTLPVRLERRGHLLVAVPESPVTPMAADEVDGVRDALITDRIEPS